MTSLMSITIKAAAAASAIAAIILGAAFVFGPL